MTDHDAALLDCWREMHPDAEPPIAKPRHRYRERDGGQAQARLIERWRNQADDDSPSQIVFPRGKR